MSEVKHTPGPWAAGRPDMATIVDGVDSKWIYDGDDQYVAVASGRIGGEWSEVTANAHLIAAAPDLLAACRICIEICEEGDTGAPFKRVVEAMIAAAAAVAKAEGR